MWPQKIARVLANELQVWRRMLYKKTAVGGVSGKTLIDAFHRLYYDSYVWNETTWFGAKVMKYPGDLVIYQQLVAETKPMVIIETGTAHGGSALFFAHLMDILGGGKVITIDTKVQPGRPAHPRIKYLTGFSTSQDIMERVKNMLRPGDRIMAVLDSDHGKDNVSRELKAYSPLVTPGNYLIVEDTNINGHPVYPAFGPGPMEAVEEFLRENHDFEIDRAMEKFLVTFNPSGFLKKRKTAK